jgi:hypothetical protein
MFKKLNFRTLLLIFGGLFVLVTVMQLLKHSRGERNFKEKLFDIDTAKVSAIILMPRHEKNEIRVSRQGNKWEFKVKDKTYQAEKNTIEDMLRTLISIKPERIAATEKSEWAKFEVTDTAPVRVKVEQKGKITADFLVGKFAYSQYRQSTYVRLFDENEVYSIDGFLAMVFNKSANDLRNKTLVNINPQDITQLSFQYPDSSYTLTKDKVWKIQGERADSAKVANYINYLASASGGDFVDDFAPSGKAALTVKIEGKNFNSFEIKAFAADTTNKYVILSSLNPESKFSGGKYNLTNRIFLGQNQFKVLKK